MEKEAVSEVAEFKKQLEQLTGDSYEARKGKAGEIVSDLAFEAEAFFGNDHKDWSHHMRELLANFEADLLNEELIQAMQELRTAEKDGNRELLAELAKKCQALSVRKAEIGRRRK